MISRKIDEKSIRLLKDLLDSSNKIVITVHSSPDGDAMGSSLGLMHVMEAIGKEARVVVPDTFLADLKILPGAKEVVVASKYPEFATQLVREADLVMCLDYNRLSRTGSLLSQLIEESPVPKVLIDHHLDPGSFATVCISHPELSSTCYLLFRVLCRLELFNLINRDAAECILAGMMTDTGNFSYNATDPEAYIVVAELLRKGADKERLYRALFNTHSEDSIRLNAYALSKNMEVFRKRHAALIWLSREELNRHHYKKGDTEGLVNRPRAIPGVYYSAFMREEDGYVTVSMRSVGDFPVNRLCEDHFGGGGHLNAAGGEFNGTLSEACELFRSLLDENMKYINDNTKL